MFKRIEFVFTEPFCTCKIENWTWLLVLEKNPNKGLTFTCKTCKTELKVTCEQFINAAIGIFEIPYPIPLKPNSQKSTSEVLADGPLREIEVGK